MSNIKKPTNRETWKPPHQSELAAWAGILEWPDLWAASARLPGEWTLRSSGCASTPASLCRTTTCTSRCSSWFHLESTTCSTWKCFVEFAQKEKLITTLTYKKLPYESNTDATLVFINNYKICQGCVTKTTRKINWRVALNFFSLLTFNFDLTTLLLKTLLIGALGFHHFTKLFNRVTPSISLTENKVFWWTKLVSIDLVRYSRMSLVWSPTDTAA